MIKRVARSEAEQVPLPGRIWHSYFGPHNSDARQVSMGVSVFPAGSKPTGVCIVDSNSPMLEALVRRDGGVPVMKGIIRDQREAVRQALLQSTADLLLVSGGSSVGPGSNAFVRRGPSVTTTDIAFKGRPACGTLWVCC